MSVPQTSLLPSVNVRAMSKRETNGLLTEWEHPLGPCNRPFGQEAHVLEVAGLPVALTVSASIVSKAVHGYNRQEVVELARIARHPEHPGVLRVALRLWRMYLGPAWSHWPPLSLVSYAMPGTSGQLYRFDGWQNWGKCRVSGGGGTWTIRNPKVSQIGDGVKTLWGFPLATPEQEDGS
jgi:hypothetical protein